VPHTLFLAVSLCLLLTASGAQAALSANELDGLAGSLIDQGFENVLVAQEPGDLVRVYYENRVFRYEMRAMGVVLALVDSGLSGRWTATLIPMRAGVPVVAVTAARDDYRRFVSGDEGAADFADALVISTSPSAPGEDECANSSFMRLDLSVGPSFSLEFEQLDDSLRGRLNAVPQAEAQVAKGVQATGQLIVPLVDEIKEKTSGVRPGRVTLDWLSRRGPMLGLARAGIFDNERYGLSIGAGRWAWGDRLLFTGHGDLTGELALRDGVWEYSSLKLFTYFLEAKYWYPYLDVTVSAGFGRFLGEEHGGRIDLMRAMGELEIGFFAIKTESDSLAGILLDIPLPLARYSKPKPVRFKTVPHVVWEYRDEVSSTGRLPGGGLSIESLYKSMAPVFIRNNVSEWMESRRFI
jgi:hypothetical protein